MGFNYAKYKAAVTGSPLNKNGFGPKEEEKTTRTGDSGSLREVISGVRTGAADLIGKIHKGFDKPLYKQFTNLEKTSDKFNESSPKNTIQNVGRLGNIATRFIFGGIPTIVGKLGGQILENVVRPGKQGQDFDNQLQTSLEEAEEEVKYEKEKKSAVPKKTDKKKKTKSKSTNPADHGYVLISDPNNPGKNQRWVHKSKLKD
jgi:hypothetical protein